jgi:hypothetical protein
MGIKVLNDRIEFGNYTLTVTDGNLTFDGTVTAASTSLAPPTVGTVDGYVSTGVTNSPLAFVTTIDKFPFATDTNATAVGNVNDDRQYHASASSQEHGYIAGGGVSNGTNAIEKFTFSATSTSTGVGSLITNDNYMSGLNSSENGYATAGGFPAGYNVIQKWSFSADGNATDVGDLTQARYDTSSNSSKEYGYVSAGNTAGDVNTIDKFPFASDANATDVGDATIAGRSTHGVSSKENGYIANFPTRVVDKFPFATDTNAAATGVTMLYNHYATDSTSSSKTHGYISAGSNEIRVEKWPFAAEDTATLVGDLSQQRYGPGGHQD